MDNHKNRFNYYKNLGLSFVDVLDIGAFEGYWTKNFKEIFPNSNVLMIEANLDKEKIIINLKIIIKDL